MSTLAEEMRAAVLLIRRAAAASRSMAAVEIIGPALDHLQAVAGYHEQMAKVAALEAELSARTADLTSVAAERDALRTALERCASFLREWDDGENLSPEKGWNFAEFEAEHAAIRSALQPSKTEK